jgi:Flp pilus assembly protein TadG
MAVIYIVIAMTAFLGIVSLAVDLGRVETAKTELRRATDAGARAAIAVVSQGTSAAQNAAIAMAGKNKCDGSFVTLTASNVSVGVWNTRTRSFIAGGTADNVTTFTAVQVYGYRTRANRNPIPLLFGQILGASTCDVKTVSVAALVAVNQVTTQSIWATSNPWLSGEPAGTLASQPDPGYVNSDHEWKQDIAGSTYTSKDDTRQYDPSKLYSTDYATDEPYTNPYEFDLPAGWAGSVIQVNITGGPGAKNDPAERNYYQADGTVDGGSISSYSDDAASNINAPGYTGPGNVDSASDATGSEHGMANIRTPINSVVGVFLNKNVPDDEGTPPPGLDFSTQTARDYNVLEPQTRQPFYVGSGQTSGGSQQSIVVPANATRLFFGTMDGHEWSNNSGYFVATITEYQIEMVQ